MLLSTLFAIALIALASWQIISRWQTYRRLKLHGILVQARVTDIKREGRLVTSVGGIFGPSQRLKYEDFLSAQWRDPLTQHVLLFKARIPNFYQFHVGEPIMVKMNPENTSEYRIQFSSQKSPTKKKSMPRAEAPSYQGYDQGYQASVPQTKVFNNEEEEYEQPKASYPPQQMPEQ